MASQWSCRTQQRIRVSQINKIYRLDANPADKWLEISADQKLLALTDSSVEWERSLIYGHPSHPVRIAP